MLFNMKKKIGIIIAISLLVFVVLSLYVFWDFTNDCKGFLYQSKSCNFLEMELPVQIQLAQEYCKQACENNDYDSWSDVTYYFPEEFDTNYKNCDDLLEGYTWNDGICQQ